MTIEVKAKDGCTCPIPGQGKTATSKAYIEVKNTIDVQRLLNDGSLTAKTEDAKPPAKEAKTSKKQED